MNTAANGHRPVGVMVTGNNCINNLGVVRSLGSHGVPVTLLTRSRRDMVRYSRYVCRKLASPDLEKSEAQFIDFLLDRGRNAGKKYVLIPTTDAEVMAFSKHKEALERYYWLPVPGYDVVQQLVNKSKFYRMLAQMAVPHPRTHFPADLKELKSIGETIGLPYIIKPALMHLFTAEFHTKCFVVNSAHDLDEAVRKLENKNLDVVIQEIIPGRGLYSLSTYFNRESRPLGVCGYDKVRQYPQDFGIGTLWKSNWREGPVEAALELLRKIKYYGLAEVEFIKDPRDGQYKFLEVNARSIMLNSLPAGCGVDTIYFAYLDTLGQYCPGPVSPRNGILWIYEIFDLLACLRRFKEGRIAFREIAGSYKGQKVFATADWKDPGPFLVDLLNLADAGLKRLLGRKR